MLDHTDTFCVPVTYSERYMGFLTFSVIPKYYLFTDILGIAKNVDSSGPSIALLEKDVIDTMGNGGIKTVDKRQEALCIDNDNYFSCLSS